MNKEEPYRDQAERLKKRIQKINETVEMSESDKLPPRELVHRQKKKRTKWKLKYPVIRLLVLCFILLPIIIFSVISYRDSGKKVTGTEKTSGDSVGYETINLEKSNKDIPEESKDAEQDQTGLSESDGSNETVTDSEQPGSSNSSVTSEQTPILTDNTANLKGSDKNSPQQTNSVKSQTSTNKTASSKAVYHTVKQQETLFNLAMKYYKTKNGVEMIKKANNLQTENIYAGQVLKIPVNN